MNAENTNKIYQIEHRIIQVEEKLLKGEELTPDKVINLLKQKKAKLDFYDKADYNKRDIAEELFFILKPKTRRNEGNKLSIKIISFWEITTKNGIEINRSLISDKLSTKILDEI